MKTNKGFTLIELILAIALAALVVLGAYNLLISNNKLYIGISSEFDIQSQVRYATTVINESTRYSTVAFAVLDEHFQGGEGELTEKWSYFGVSKDKQEILHYEWDEDKNIHIKEILVPKEDGYYYDLYFYQREETENERIINYELLVTKKNNDDKNKQEIIDIKTEIEALSAIQIVDRGLYSDEKSVALAYRTDPTPKAESQHAVIAMVLDTSGSMNWNMKGEDEVIWSKIYGDLRVNGISQKVGEPAKWSWGQWLEPNYWYYNVNSYLYRAYYEPYIYSRGYVKKDESKTRINILKNQAKFLVEEFKNNQIQGDLRLIEFNTRASYKTEWVDIQNDKQRVIEEINKLDANGGTNTGDGLRRAYYGIDDKNKKLNKVDKEVKNYMIILVDGVTTQYSTLSKWNDSFYLDNKRAPYVTGKGSSLDLKGEEYVKTIGKMIQGKNPYTDHNIITFIIGFSDKWENGKYVELESVNTIAEACGIEKEHHFDVKNKDNPVKDDPKYVFWAKDEDSLKNVFNSISKTIEADFWQVSGPDN